MKICDHLGCNNYRFSHGYCKNHQHLRTDKPKTRIKPVSDKRAAQLEQYNIAKLNAWEKALYTGNNRCFVCTEIMFGPDWHHLDGREEDLLLDEKYLRFVHRKCHNEIHGLAYDFLKLKPWYEGYLQRLKAVDEKLYDKEYEKRFKTTQSK